MLHGYLKAVGINVQLDSQTQHDSQTPPRWVGKPMMMYVLPAGIEKDMSVQLRERLSIKARLPVVVFTFPPIITTSCLQ